MSLHPAQAIRERVEVAKAAVLAQVDLLQANFGRAETQWKSDGTRVTAVDLAISADLVERLSRCFPEDQIFSEELTEADAPIPLTSRYVWVLDPIDGTNNYAMGIAHCAISLALLEDGVPVYGVIYDLSRHALIHGGPGVGVFDGDRRVGVRMGELNAQSLIGFHSPSDKRFSGHVADVAAYCKLRALGSSTLHLAYVAVGILDGTVDHNVKVWDIAAAVPLVEAGGGRLTYLNGPLFPLRSFDLRMGRIFYVAGSPSVAGRLEAILAARVIPAAT
jgi:myo-inositol-1(or 4)-monophosphatase